MILNFFISTSSNYLLMTNLSADTRRKIMSIIKNETISVSELSKRTKLRRDFVAGYLEALRHMGEVKVVTIGRAKVYSPAKKTK